MGNTVYIVDYDIPEEPAKEGSILQGFEEIECIC
jgi:hypothetical protein